VANDNLAVVRMSQNAGGKTYKSVRFVYKADGAEYVWVFDEASGLLLFYRHAIGGDDDRYRQLTQITLVRQRQLRLPWRAASVPDWVREGSRFTYRGTYSVLLPGAEATALPYELTAEVTRSENRWTEFQVDASLQRQTPNRSVRASGVLQPFDGLWLPAEALERLVDGQVLDRDPVTGTEIRVLRERGALSLAESGKGHHAVMTYDDRGGILTGLKEQIRNGAGTIQVDVALAKKP
jgi:hypothetical protein